MAVCKQPDCLYLLNTLRPLGGYTRYQETPLTANLFNYYYLNLVVGTGHRHGASELVHETPV